MPILSTWRIGVSPEPGRRDWSRSPQGVHIMRAHSERERKYTDHHTPRVIQVDQAHSYCSRSPSPRRSRSRSYSPTRCIVSDSPSHVGIDDEPTPMAVRQVEIVETGVPSATFNVPGRSNIPSDQGDHKVLIGSLDFPISPEWICIPRKDESVFLRYKIVNSSQFIFLPGEASVFIGDDFVSKSQIQHVLPNDSFQLSLGTDPTLRVTYAPIQTHNRTTSESGFNFPGRQKQPKQVITKFSQQISIRNTRPTVVPALHILDHIPVSNLETLKVVVTSPQGLRENHRPTDDTTVKRQDEGWVRPQRGVRARWAPLDMAGEGTIQWLCALGVGEELELKLGWEVSAPEGTEWKSF
ncbi:Protein F37C4,5 OS=Caenorhabditis elegans GN=F37C4.5 PE=1 SV=3 [Rhizoctonia solani AG-1 IB]|uniref:Protein F37C4,5 n=1 Tax=Thanatephorus cucumeris (strain AG1-IB / isolate 7/3/14) TaxID=1108050 RepID=A0A0B7FLZ4_THACB|nr:Protein F37C4,5 OS=Caenorhabditis elegans GN=F37C4.5 PE=1 SV=3 [Rhizoctonia solani AG-1 IB]